MKAHARHGFRKSACRWVAGLSLMFAFASAHAASEQRWIAPVDVATRWAALAEPAFKHWSIDAGVPHPVVTALAQDGVGFIWVGTQNGLARWDGYQFTTYKADPQTAGSLPANYVQTLHVDPQGDLWVGANNGGLVRFNVHTGRFEPPFFDFRIMGTL